MTESSPKGSKTLQEKKKLLVMSNFSFSHSVFKRLVLQTCKNQDLFGKGLSFTTTLKVKTLEDTVQKGENDDLHFSPLLAHLSTVYSRGAFRVTRCQSSVMCHQQFFKVPVAPS